MNKKRIDVVSVTVLLTCHNRKEKTKSCIESIYDEKYAIQYIITDDGSSDGTEELLKQLQQKYNIIVIKGTGSLFWCGGMRKSIAYAQEQVQKTNYYVFVNDDVRFAKGALERAISRSRKLNNSVIVGATCNEKGELTYGAIRYQTNSVRYHTVEITDNEKCDTFNCNFVLLPEAIFGVAGNFDSYYQHAMADFDYGFHIQQLGYNIFSTEEYVGLCERNSVNGTWHDTSLSRGKRIRIKESEKGLPIREWYYFLKKNFGFRKAVWHSITPYVKILIGK